MRYITCDVHPSGTDMSPVKCQFGRLPDGWFEITVQVTHRPSGYGSPLVRAVCPDCAKRLNLERYKQLTETSVQTIDDQLQDWITDAVSDAMANA